MTLFKATGVIMAGLYFALAPLSTWACDYRLEKFPQECQLQDRYTAVKTGFEKFDVDVEQLATYRALRFIAHYHWNPKKAGIDYLPWFRYDPKPVTWMFWERGVAEAKEVFQGNSLSINDLKRVHREIIDPAIIRKVSLRKGAWPGKIRNRPWQKAPSWKAKCSDWPLSEAEFNLLKNYDLKSVKGKPLVRIKKAKRCKGKTPRGEGVFYKARVVYLKSTSVPANLEKYFADLNKGLALLDEGNSPLSPLEFAADAQRRLISIHPHGDGNGRMARLIQDYITQRYGLPFAPSGRLTEDLTSVTVKYRQIFKQVTFETMSELEKCLVEHQQQKASGDCRAINKNYSNENDKISLKKNQFKKELAKFLQVRNEDLKKYIENNKYIGEISKGKEEDRE